LGLWFDVVEKLSIPGLRRDDDEISTLSVGWCLRLYEQDEEPFSLSLVNHTASLAVVVRPLCHLDVHKLWCRLAVNGFV
jgi:hypothetical protein